MKTYYRILILTLATMFAASSPAQVPGILTYRGRISVGGVHFNGAGQFKFALVSPANPAVTTYWSNDGSSNAGSEPAAAVSIQVADGLFTIALGDTAIPNMTTIPASVFENPDVRLRTWFNDGVNGSVQLTPDQRVTSVGYALRAAGTTDGAISADMLANGAVGGPQLANSSVTETKIADGAVTPEKIPANSISGQKIAQNSLSSEDIADTLRLRDLDIESDEGLDRIQLGVENNSGVLYMNHGTIGRFFAASGTTDGGFLRLFDALGGIGLAQTTVELGSSSFGGYVRVLQDNATTGVQMNGQNGDQPGGTILVYQQAGLGVVIQGQSTGGGSEVSIRNAAGKETVELLGAESANNTGGQIVVRRGNEVAGLVFDGQFGTGGGQISVRNGTGEETVEILGNESSDNQGGQVTVKRQDGKAGVTMDGQFGNGGGEVRIANAAGATTIHLQGTEGDGAGDGAGQILIRQSDGQTGILIDAQAGALGGQMMINNVAGQTRVNIVGQQESGGGYIGVRDANGTVTAQIAGAEIGSQGAQIALAKANGVQTVFLDAELGGNGGSIRLAKSDGSIPIKLDASASGGGRVTTQVLEITGGSDLSEKFNVRANSQTPEPGMIVSIDPERPGELITSTRAYDRTVAGVISGAGGVQPGMLMGQAGSVADGKHPVALTGRVYCWVDADHGAVQPGDLLTTSATPGHAMRVDDHTRAHGAILGKAMTPLKSGRGLVLVLVSLQ